jgi:hypothetical protein
MHEALKSEIVVRLRYRYVQWGRIEHVLVRGPGEMGGVFKLPWVVIATMVTATGSLTRNETKSHVFPKKYRMPELVRS